MAVMEMDKVGELEGRLSALRSIRTTLEKQEAQLKGEREENKARRPALTKALVDGDHHAAKRLDDLDSEERGIVRRLDGLSAHLASLAADVAPLEAELAKESAREAVRQREKEAKAAEATGDSDLAEYKAAFLKANELAVKVQANSNDFFAKYPDLDGSRIATRWYDGMNVNLGLTNSGWEPTQKRFGAPSVVQIRLLVPPVR